MPAKINVAVLGLGNMGSTHVKSAQASPWVDKVVGYEPDPARAAERGKELGIPATSDLAAILKNPAIRMVSIAASNDAHPELAIKAMRAGKAVLCEKPIAESLADAKEVVRVQQETGAFLQIGFEARYSKLYMKVKEWIDAGRIGKPLNSHCDYWCSEMHRKNSWRSNSPGSLIGEKLSHYLDLPRWWFGNPVTEVFSIAAPNFVTYLNHPDNHQINYRFADGAVSTLTFFFGTAAAYTGDPLTDTDMFEVQVDDGHRLVYVIYGTKGVIETDVFRRRIRRFEFTDSPEKLVCTLAETLNFPKEEDSQWFHNVHDQNLRLFQRVAEDKSPENPAADSLETMKLCFAAEKSELEKRVVKLSEM